MTMDTPATTTAGEKLLPCPFCGSADIECAATGVFWVKCYDPNCSGEGPTRDTEAEAIAAWNTRAPSPALSLAQEALHPFAKAADNYADVTDEARYIDEDATVTVAHLREARQALSAAPGDPAHRERMEADDDLMDILVAWQLGYTNNGSFADWKNTWARLDKKITALRRTHQDSAGSERKD